MGLPRLSIKYPVSTLMVMLIAILIGVVSLLGSPMELMPKLNPPAVVVMTLFPGASPSEVTELVTKPLEEAVAATAGLSSLSSTSQENLSLMTVQFDWGTDMSDARAELQQAIDRVQLPEGAQKPSLVKFNPNALPVMELTATGDDDLVQLKRQVDEEIVPRLEKVDGVAAVFVTGAADREIQVQLDNAKLSRYGLTQQQVAGVIQASNLTYPAGRIGLGDQSLNLRIVGEIGTVDELKGLLIAQVPAAAPVPGTPVAQAAATQPPAAQPQVLLTPVLLSDIAEVREGQADPDVLNSAAGEPSLRITIQKEGEANTVAVARAIGEELDEMRKDYRDVDLDVIVDQGDTVSASVNNVGISLLGGGLLAMLVLLFFLRNLRPTLIIGVAIPFSVIVTFVLLYMNDLTLNLMTLGGLALGVGMLVDNAIVVIENIYRHLNELGEDPFTAAERGANEVAGAITSSTLTTVAVFLPIVFVGGLTGELFKEMALTVTFSLLASLAVALTVIPMMASRFLRPQAVSKHPSRENGYTRVLRWALSNRAITLVAAVALLAATVGGLFPQIGKEFIPATDEGTFIISVKLPPGTSLESAAAKVDELARAVSKAVPAEIVTASTGRPEGLAGLSAAINGGSSGDGQIRVSLEDDYDEPTTEAIEDARRALEKIQGDAVLSYAVENSVSMGGAAGNGVQVIVTGPDRTVLQELVHQTQEEMAAIEGLVNLENNLDTSRPELQVVVDQQKAMRQGLAPAQVAVAVADAVKGKVITRLESGGTTTDVRVRFRPEDRADVAQIERILLKSPLGKSIPLRDVAAVKQATGPVSITREDQKTSAQITGLAEGRDLGSVTVDLNGMIDDLDVPEGYEVTLGGTSRLMSEGFDGLSIALIMAVLLVYMIMASQFESLLHPATILITLPLAMIGAVAGLYVTDNALGITAMIGVIILAGIVVNNGIVLVDYINKLRASGMALTEAVVEAGRTRLRPILMTALTTILGLLPLALKIGEGSEVQAPMAVTVIGGLLTSTVLTLVVIPVVYHLTSLGGARVAGVVAQVAVAEDPVAQAPVAPVAPAPVAPVAPEEGENLPTAHGLSEEDMAQMLKLMRKLVAASASRP